MVTENALADILEWSTPQNWSDKYQAFVDAMNKYFEQRYYEENKQDRENRTNVREFGWDEVL